MSATTHILGNTHRMDEYIPLSDWPVHCGYLQEERLLMWHVRMVSVGLKYMIVLITSETRLIVIRTLKLNFRRVMTNKGTLMMALGISLKQILIVV